MRVPYIKYEIRIESTDKKGEMCVIRPSPCYFQQALSLLSSLGIDYSYRTFFKKERVYKLAEDKIEELWHNGIALGEFKHNINLFIKKIPHNR